jgi:putative effector of murein hydrolase
MKWIVLITTALFYIDMFLLYKMYNLILLPLLIGGTIVIGIILLSIVIFKQYN